jgi:hypothetical protein
MCWCRTNAMYRNRMSRIELGKQRDRMNLNSNSQLGMRNDCIC